MFFSHFHILSFLLADHDACQVNKGGCSHGCVNLPMGFVCVCPENMRLLRDNQCEGEWRPKCSRGTLLSHQLVYKNPPKKDVNSSKRLLQRLIRAWREMCAISCVLTWTATRPAGATKTTGWITWPESVGSKVRRFLAQLMLWRLSIVFQNVLACHASHCSKIATQTWGTIKWVRDWVFPYFLKNEK